MQTITSLFVKGLIMRLKRWHFVNYILPKSILRRGEIYMRYTYKYIFIDVYILQLNYTLTKYGLTYHLIDVRLSSQVRLLLEQQQTN